MKRIIFAMLIGLIGISACKTVDYDWENYKYTAVPIVTLDTAKSALATRQAAKVSFFNLKSADVGSQQFGFSLNWEGFGLVTVSSIEVYASYNKAEASVPGYPIVINYPGNQYPNIYQFPIPSVVKSTEKLYDTATTFPKTYSFTANELATLTGANLSTVEVNDYFLFKFILNLSDGRRIITFFNNVCDESRGEPGDCRVGVRFKNQ
ncbi:hypothetical protein ADIARSV_1653 [Arcticibacter svalbardensis MN12-7]|uniref:Lipoprotein n=1 Tax=Arcticibacter svalbardensis MN12-7 TaxID=1150600 RepID=R9GUJ5_9SPHI|nr:hypothetical protein [Arcticibacter svalbardensis]EOR95165.1 hypothetical protein ADIARSV_1653 [Arcticibacter svalbardensis MN12-7]